MSDLIIYGGAFNPPTKGHLRIIEYLVEHFPNKKIIILPTNNFYKSKDIVSFNHRKKMLEIMCMKFKDSIEISDYEQTLEKYCGTYYTLEYFNNPYFVIGADSLETMNTWIKYPDVFIKNKFIVFPRDGVNINEVIANTHLYQQYRNNFIVCDDFIENNISSTGYRKYKNESFLVEEVLEYIKANKLYE